MSAMTMVPAIEVRSAVRPATAVRPAAPRSAGRMRLTRRGRVVLATLACLMVVALGMVAGRAFAAGPSEPLVYQTVVVAPGQTLWEIAGTVSGERDVRDVVLELVELNELGSAQLLAGQELLVPEIG